jgi:hypothetical protein
MCKMSGRVWEECLGTPIYPSPESVLSFVALGWKNIVPEPDDIAVLERRQKVLEDEIKKVLRHYPTDDPIIHDLMRGMLQLRDEWEKYKTLASIGARQHTRH